MNDTSIVQFYRGPKKVIDKIDTLEDGKLFFATDTKQIMMDCNFTDSLNNNYNKRITFGGSTGIVYGIRGPFQEGEDFKFKLTELENAEELPNINDLILNDDGCFYRVTDVFTTAQEVGTERLTLQGSGGSGTGGGGRFYKNYVTDSISYFSINDEKIPISFGCYYEDGIEPLQIELTVNDQAMGSLGAIAKDQIRTIDLMAYKNLLKSNAANMVRLKFTALDSEASTYMTFNVFIHDIYIEIDEGSQNINPQPDDCDFTVKPFGGTGSMFIDRVLVYELRAENSETIIWSQEYKTKADIGEKVTYYIPHQAHGTYILTVYLKVSIQNTDKIITSSKYQVQIPYYDADQSAPLITTNTLNNEYTQYSSDKVKYMVTYYATSTSNVNLIIEIDKGRGKELVKTIFTNINNNEWCSWDVLFNEVGVYYLTIKLDGTEYYKSIPPISVIEYVAEEGSSVPVIDTKDAQLRLYLTSKGHLNDDINKDLWESDYGSQKIKCELNGFNWMTNGWIEDNKGDMALHLTNGATVTVPFSPFERDSNQKGAERNGRVIEIDFKISNIRDLTKPGITCKSTYTSEVDGAIVEKINTGIQIYGNKAQLFSVLDTPKYEDMSGRTTIFKENERIHLTYIINSLTDTPGKIVYTLLNGVVSSLSLYDEKDQFVDESSKNASKFIFDSTYMDIDIYNIRVYGTSKTPNFILQNHFADGESIDEAVQKWRVNNVISSIEAAYDPKNLANTKKCIGIDLDKVKDTIKIPYMIFEDGRQTSDKKDKGWENDDAEVTYPISSESRLPTGKKDFRHMTVTYVDPEHPENNIPAGTVVTCYAQGTSSLEYPVKNLRIYFKEDPYTLFPDVPPVNLFTLKADYMESSSSHNTGTANALNELYHSIGLDEKLPNRKYFPSNQNILTAILGKPIICFYKPYQQGCSEAYPYYYQYIGRYNFNYDKATHEIFGFESLTAEETVNGEPYGYLTEADGKTLRAGFNTALEVDEDADRTYYRIPSLDATEEQKVTIAKEDEKAFEAAAKLGPLYEYKDSKVTTVQCWEFLNNTSPLVGFRTTWNEEVDKVEVKGTNDEGKEVVLHAPYQDWVGAFESRYPEHTDEASSDKRALARVVNWIANLNRHPDVVRAALQARKDAGENIEINDDTIATEQEHRLRRFKNEFNDYFLKDFVTFYYVLTEFLVMMDSRGKNMMFACYDADPDNDIGHWLPIFYDMDTMLGLNNSGRLVYSYDVEDDEANLYNLAATYESTQYSVLWCNFKDAFQEDIKTMYNDLRGKNVFNINTFLKLYNERQGDAWNEVYLNEDADYKYIDPLVNNYTVEVEDDAGNTITKTASDYLYAAQGSRSQHRAYWLQRRFEYLDSKYDYAAKIGTSLSVLNVRLSSEIQKPSLPFNATYNFIPKYNQYVTLSYQNSGSEVGGMVGPVRLYEGIAKEVVMPIDTAKDQEAYFYGIENMKDIGLQADKYYQKFIITRPLNVTSLDIGTFIKGWENDGLGSKDKMTISDPNGKTAFLPFLESLNIQNCSAVSDTLSLVQCPYLQELYAYGTNIPSVSFFEGGNLKHLELPSTTSTLTLKGQLFFDTFTKRSDEEVAEFQRKHKEKIAASLNKSLAGKELTDEEIQATIEAIELTETQREHLTLEGYDNLTSLRISNCPLIDSKSFVKKLLKSNDDGTYRTNLRYFRMEDINWIITKDECVLETINEDGIEKVQIKTIPILDTLVNINGINNADSTIERQSAGNDYFAGTITIDNTDGSFGVSEYILYNLYEKLFPNLKFVYTTNEHCTKAYFIGINNALNQADSKYSKKIAATEIDDIAENLIDWFTPTKFEDGSWDATHVPPSTKTSNNKYDYKFVGWSLSKSQSFDEDSFIDFATQKSKAKEACVIIVEENEDKTYTVTTNNDFSLTTDSFVDQELHFYPVYLGIIRFYPVRFYWKKNNEDILLKEEQVKYGMNATPPAAPLNIVLDDMDKTKVTIYPFVGYDIPYTNIQVAVSTYAKFGSGMSIKDMVDNEIPLDYFEKNDNDPIDLPPNSVGLYIKADFKGEALIVPKMWDGKLVRFIGTHSGEIPDNLKRIFFEKDNEVLAICDTLMSSQSQFEYIDFSALTKLTWIGPNAFQNCPNLYVPTLPDSITQIENNAFYECPGVVIKKLPDSLESLGTSVFQKCTGLSSLNINNTKLKIISDSTFSGCSNLTIVGETIDCDIEVIGEKAFEYCENLVLNFEDSGSLNPLKELKYSAFGECNSLSLNNLPNQLEVIGNAAFIGKSGTNSVINTNIIPMHVKKMDIGAFMFRRLADKFNGLFIIENPDIDINEGALSNFLGVKYILVPASVDTTVAPWHNKLGASGAKYITSLDQMV